MTAPLSFGVHAHGRWNDIPAFWRAADGPIRPTPFQSDAIMASWYATIGAAGVLVPLIIELTFAGGLPYLLLPLVLERRAGLRIATFADGGVIDNAAPLIAPAALSQPADAAQIIAAVQRGAPGIDALNFAKQPAVLGGWPNPLAQGPSARPSRLSAHPIMLGDTLAPYKAARTKHFRKEQERIRRVFERNADAGFDLVTDMAAAEAVHAFMDDVQRARLDALGIVHDLDRPEIAAFYRQVLATGMPADAAVYGVLRAGGEIVAALLAFVEGERATLVRLAHRGGEWAKASPGRLVVDRMIEALHGRGIRVIDLSIGDYHYKEGFGGGTVPLRELHIGLSVPGKLYVAALRGRRALARQTWMRAIIARLGINAAARPSKA